jgi:hypothetical protein
MSFVELGMMMALWRGCIAGIRLMAGLGACAYPRTKPGITGRGGSCARRGILVAWVHRRN